jgi:hypothetical protein
MVRSQSLTNQWLIPANPYRARSAPGIPRSGNQLSIPRPNHRGERPGPRQEDETLRNEVLHAGLKAVWTPCRYPTSGTVKVAVASQEHHKGEVVKAFSARDPCNCSQLHKQHSASHPLYAGILGVFQLRKKSATKTIFR